MQEEKKTLIGRETLDEHESYTVLTYSDKSVCIQPRQEDHNDISMTREQAMRFLAILQHMVFDNDLGQELLELAGLRRRVVKENDPIGRLFASMREESNRPPSWNELDEKEKALEVSVPGFSVRYAREFGCYVLVPGTAAE
jgi:hypothetical protein